MREKKITKTEVKESMLKRLAAMGADQPHYADLVGDYIALWDIKEKLIKDVRKRGVTYKDVSSVGVEMQKNNPSTKELIGVNRQMLSILEKLNLVTTAASAGGGEDETL